MASKNNNPKGIILILLAMMVFSVQDSLMKYIYSFVSLYEVYLVRTLVSFIIILLFLIPLALRKSIFSTKSIFTWSATESCQSFQKSLSRCLSWS